MAERRRSRFEHFRSYELGHPAMLITDLVTPPLKNAAEGLKSLAAGKSILN